MSSLDDLLQKLWVDYSTMNKQAATIHEALAKRGETVVNDHVAFRTFDVPKVGIDVLAAPFLKLGYSARGEAYHFKQKKLHARHYEHEEPGRPKIFISALKIDECSKELAAQVHEFVDAIPDSLVKDSDFLVSGTPWKAISSSQYETLLKESEYAAWMATFGFRVNHFTVFFNSLSSFADLKELNEFIKQLGFDLNDAGGEIKGSPKEMLEQSSTKAYPVEVQFSDKTMKVPGCYYEFARRYADQDGSLFHGFVTQSADKLFESTNVKRRKG